MSDKQQTEKDESKTIINNSNIPIDISGMTPAQLIANVLDAGKSHQGHLLEVAFLNGMLCAFKMTKANKMTLKDKKALIIALTWLDSALLTFIICHDEMGVLLCHTTWIVLLSILYFCKPFMRWLCKKGDMEK